MISGKFLTSDYLRFCADEISNKKMLLGNNFVNYIILIDQHWKYPNFGCFVSLNVFFPYLKIILSFKVGSYKQARKIGVEPAYHAGVVHNTCNLRFGVVNMLYDDFVSNSSCHYCSESFILQIFIPLRLLIVLLIRLLINDKFSLLFIWMILFWP